LVFSDEKKFDIEQSVNLQNDIVWSPDWSVATRTATRSQNPMSLVVWAAVTATGRSPLVFVPSRVKLNSQRYISDILEAVLLPWACKRLQRLTMEFFTRLCPITWLKHDPKLDSGSHSSVH
jgi:hypothetical protein